MLWKVAPGNFDIMMGSSSGDIFLHDSLEVTDSPDGLLNRGLSTQPDFAR
jgi:hypothetical protein